MPLTITQARDEMLGRVKALVDGISAGDRPEIVWDDAFKEKPKTATSKWMRVGLNHKYGGQASLAGAAGDAMFTQRGLLIAQIFTPAGQGQRLSDQLTRTILQGFRNYATPGGVWFRNQHPSEVGTIGANYQMDVIVEFEYTEIQ